MSSPRPSDSAGRTGRAWATLALAVALWSGTASAASIPGWPEVRFGMTEDELEQALGDALTVLPGRWIYGGAYAERAVFDVDLEGLLFTAYFQMNDQTDRLQQILLERRNIGATPRAFEEALALLERHYGEPTERCLTVRPDGTVMSADLMWRFPRAVIHAGFLNFQTTGVLYYDPNVDLDPMVPSFETRRINRRSLPRRITIRIHPRERTDLEWPEGCPKLRRLAPPADPGP